MSLSESSPLLPPSIVAHFMAIHRSRSARGTVHPPFPPEPLVWAQYLCAALGQGDGAGAADFGGEEEYCGGRGAGGDVCGSCGWGAEAEGGVEGVGVWGVSVCAVCRGGWGWGWGCGGGRFGERVEGWVGGDVG